MDKHAERASRTSCEVRELKYGRSGTCKYMVASYLLWGTWVEIYHSMQPIHLLPVVPLVRYVSWNGCLGCFVCRWPSRTSCEGRELKYYLLAHISTSFPSYLLWGTWVEMSLHRHLLLWLHRRTSCEVRELKSITARFPLTSISRTSCEVRELKFVRIIYFRILRCRTSCEVRELKFQLHGNAIV